MRWKSVSFKKHKSYQAFTLAKYDKSTSLISDENVRVSSKSIETVYPSIITSLSLPDGCLYPALPYWFIKKEKIHLKFTCISSVFSTWFSNKKWLECVLLHWYLIETDRKKPFFPIFSLLKQSSTRKLLQSRLWIDSILISKAILYI